MTETSATKPPQLRAARARKQSIIKFVILFVTLAFLFVPLLAMLIFTLRHPLSGRWSAAPWIAIFTGNGESLGADLTVLWQGIGTSLAHGGTAFHTMLGFAPSVLFPRGVVVGCHGFDFGAGHAFPLAEAAFTQSLVTGDWQSQNIGEGVCGLLGTEQVGGHHHHAPAGGRSLLELARISAFGGVRTGLGDGFGMLGKSVHLGPVIP